MESSSFSFFTVADASPESTSALDPKGDPIRKRAPHRKSRNGCSQCRRKKIKCDEIGPVCRNCQKSRLKCELPIRTTHSQPDARAITPPHTPQMPTPRSSTPQSPRILTNSWTLTKLTRPSEKTTGIQLNALMSLVLKRSAEEIELLRHFERQTSSMLAMSRSAWSTFVLRLSLQYDCLMDCICLIAATHINDQLPANHPDRKSQFVRYGKALSSLQVALAEAAAHQMTTIDFDALLSSSLLIHHYSWTFVDESASVSAIFEESVSLSRGFKHLFIVGQDVAQHGEWWRILGYSPRINLERYGREAEPEEDLLGDLLYHCFFCGQGTRDLEGSSADNMYAATRLTIVMRAIFLALPSIEQSGYGSDILRYLFTWPSLCTKGYLEQVRDGNMTSLTILMGYYAAILRVYSKKIWFMRDKALFMYNALRRKLEGRCAKCLKPIMILYDGRPFEEYAAMTREDVRSSVCDG